MTDAVLLPFVDAWSTEISASPRVVWEVVLGMAPGATPSLPYRLWAWAWAADPPASNGLAAHVLGAERPGFAVCEVVPPLTYALAGRHRFARYQVVFRIEQRGAGRSRLTAETYAEFPGWPGRLYRTALLDARLHGVVMWVMVRRVRRRAEALARERDQMSS
ncbi:SRPBCC family protein [Luteitalea sp.]|uniref:SRPBCC family protein n=1 Tax=Luteitalea sp. TaxID=2004800 RepID=UPI0037C6BB2D